MDHEEVGKIWDENAEVWTKLARMGYDIYRDHLNSPAFFKMLPDISGLKGLDIGCGEGYNTRLAAQKGAKMTAFDISKTFIQHAIAMEEKKLLKINYKVASAVELSFSDNEFDFAIATMSLMDIPENDIAISEAYRVIKPGGFFQFSITHPCFFKKGWEWLRNENDEKLGMVCSNYFYSIDGDIEEWIFSAAPKKITENMKNFKIPRFERTLSQWLNLLIKTGFIFEEFNEPYADDDAIERFPNLKDTRIVPIFFIVRCRKP